MKARPVLAEVLGTFALTLSVSLSIHNPAFPVPAPAMAALTLMVLVYLLGPISGCLLNPAVTIGVWSIRRLRAWTAITFVAAQFAGAGLALAAANLLFAASTPPAKDAAFTTGVAELMGAALLTFTVAAVFLGRIPDVLLGVVIGAALLVSSAWAAHGSNGVLNPAVAFGIGSLSPSYAWGPLAGALVGAHAARHLVPYDDAPAGSPAAESGTSPSAKSR